MKTLAKGILATLLFAITTSLVFGQKGAEDGSRYGHGEDSVRCIKNLSLYRSNVKSNDYGEITLNSWLIVYMECPQASKYIYIDGITLIKKAISATKDAEQKKVLIDSMMRIYDKRIVNYGQKGFVLADKGVNFIKYSEKTTENMQVGYDYLKESIALEKYKCKAAQLLTFMQASKALFGAGVIEGRQVVEDYGKVSEISDYIIENKKKGHLNVAKAKVSIDQVFETSGAATCTDLVPFYTDKFEKTPEDIEFLKKSINMLKATKCLDSKIYYSLLEKLNTLEPTAKLAAELAKINYQAEKLTEASTYYLQAIELEVENEQKAKLYLELGDVTRKSGNNSKARTYALKSAELNPASGLPYILIGTMYASSSKECGDEALDQKSVYWAAVDKMIQAKKIDPELTEDANKYIESYKARFLNSEDIFFYTLKLGDPFTVGCWINEKTTVRASDK